MHDQQGQIICTDDQRLEDVVERTAENAARRVWETEECDQTNVPLGMPQGMCLLCCLQAMGKASCLPVTSHRAHSLPWNLNLRPSLGGEEKCMPQEKYNSSENGMAGLFFW